MTKILKRIKSMLSLFEADLSDIFDDITEEDFMYDEKIGLSFASYHKHPSQYELEIKTFPEIKPSMNEEDLLFLLLEMEGMSLMTKQNLFSYIFINCDEETFDKFQYMFDEDEIAEVFPDC